MRRFWIILPSLIVLAACANAPPPGSGAPQQGVTASFPPGGVVGVIKIAALDPAPAARGRRLVAPDGTESAASSLDVDANPQNRSADRARSPIPWRPSMLGSNGINPLPSGVTDPTVRSRNQLLLTVSTADITLPDAVAYRRDWANYKIRLNFAGPGDSLDTREIPAPQPPPEKPAGLDGATGGQATRSRRHCHRGCRSSTAPRAGSSRRCGRRRASGW